MRLADGQSHTEGRVEVCLHHSWGTVCQNEWDRTDSNVLCNQLGFQKYGECMHTIVIIIISLVILPTKFTLFFFSFSIIIIYFKGPSLCTGLHMVVDTFH